MRAHVASDRWITYEVQLRARDGDILASAIKKGWHETGIWREGGESGMWEEKDLRGGFDIKLTQQQEMRLAIAVLDYTDTTGEPVEEKARFDVTVRNGVIDTRYLWAGLAGTAALGVLAAIALNFTGKRIINASANDSDVSARGVVGGRKSLVKVKVVVLADENAPGVLQVHLNIRDRNGELVQQERLSVLLRWLREDGEIQGGRGIARYFVLLEPRDSYGFYVETVPDGPVDRVTLFVDDGVRTLTPIEVHHLTTSAA